MSEVHLQFGSALAETERYVHTNRKRRTTTARLVSVAFRRQWLKRVCFCL